MQVENVQGKCSHFLQISKYIEAFSMYVLRNSDTLERIIFYENWIQLCTISVEHMPIIARVYKFRHPEGNLYKVLLQSSSSSFLFYLFFLSCCFNNSFIEKRKNKMHTSCRSRSRGVTSAQVTTVCVFWKSIIQRHRSCPRSGLLRCTVVKSSRIQFKTI